MLSALSWLALAATPAEAHKPFFGPGYDSAEDALVLDDPDVSIVLYSEVSCEAPQTWLTFDAQPGYQAWVQLGVPELDRLEDYRPSLAVVAPGLPAADLPFALPEGTGAKVFDSRDLDQVDDFYEPFTQTSSWVLVEELVTLPEGGPAWVVAWDPEGRTGKLWVAVGTVEDFSDVDFSEFADIADAVHAFHETGTYEDPPELEEQVCTDGAAPQDQAAPAAGCSSAPAGGLVLALAGLLLGVGRRLTPR